MSEPFLAQVMVVSFNFAPKGWALCNGQLLPINQNQALFSLLGTVYGGNGQTTFALPNLRGCCMPSVGPEFSVLGEAGGEEAHTISMQEMPAHTHPWVANSSAGSQPVPGGALLGNANNFIASPPDGAGGAMIAGMTTNIGGSQPHTNMSPYLVLNWCIALQGIFPSRN